MSQSKVTAMTRRSLLAGAAGAGLVSVLPRLVLAGELKLIAAPAKVPLVAPGFARHDGTEGRTVYDL